MTERQDYEPKPRMEEFNRINEAYDMGEKLWKSAKILIYGGITNSLLTYGSMMKDSLNDVPENFLDATMFMTGLLMVGAGSLLGRDSNRSIENGEVLSRNYLGESNDK